MATYYVGGTHFFNRFSNLQAAIERAVDGDIIELHKNAYDVSIPVKHNITIRGNGHFITPVDGKAALICNTFITLDDIWFECKPNTNAIKILNGGNLTKITTRIKGPAKSLYPTLIQYGGTLSLEECDLMKLETQSAKDAARNTVTDIKKSVIRDYYGGFAFINGGSNRSVFQGITNISESFIMCSVFKGDTTLSDSVLMNFNAVTGTMRLISCTLRAQKGEVENRTGEPSDGPLKDWDSKVSPYSLFIYGANVTVENLTSKAMAGCFGFIMNSGSLDIRNTTSDNDKTGHRINGGSVKFSNVTDNARYDINNARYSLVNSNVNIHSNTRSAMDELNEMIGLGAVKRQLRTILNTIQINLQHPEKDHGFSHHMVFAGDPGTGKTSVAKLVAKALYEIGAIPENKCMEVPASQLIKGYVGQTGEHVEAIMKEALGGVIFIDEAYELMVKDGQNSFNNDALAVLLRYMEDHRGDLVVIAAGYEKEMREFLASNVCLTRRFQWVSFEDYTPSELADIFMLMSKRLEETYDINDPHSVLEQCFRELTDYYLSHPDAKGRVTNGGNGGLARNLFQQVIFARNNRVARSGDEAMKITLADIRVGFHEEMAKAMNVI